MRVSSDRSAQQFNNAANSERKGGEPNERKVEARPATPAVSMEMVILQAVANVIPQINNFQPSAEIEMDRTYPNIRAIDVSRIRRDTRTRCCLYVLPVILGALVIEAAIFLNVMRKPDCPS